MSLGMNVDKRVVETVWHLFLLVRITVLTDWRIREIRQSWVHGFRPRRDLPLAAHSIAHRAVISAVLKSVLITLDGTWRCQAMKR